MKHVINCDMRLLFTLMWHVFFLHIIKIFSHVQTRHLSRLFMPSVSKLKNIFLGLCVSMCVIVPAKNWWQISSSRVCGGQSKPLMNF